MSNPNNGYKINLFIICSFIILFHSSRGNITTTTVQLQRNNGSFQYVANGTKHFVLTKERRAVLILKYRSDVNDSSKRQDEEEYEDNHVNAGFDGPPILRSGTTLKTVLSVLTRNSTTRRRKSRTLSTKAKRTRTKRRSKKYVDSLLYEEYDHTGKRVNHFYMRNLKEVADFMDYFLDMHVCYGSC